MSEFTSALQYKNDQDERAHENRCMFSFLYKGLSSATASAPASEEVTDNDPFISEEASPATCATTLIGALEQSPPGTSMHLPELTTQN